MARHAKSRAHADSSRQYVSAKIMNGEAEYNAPGKGRVGIVQPTGGVQSIIDVGKKKTNHTPM